MKAYILFIMFFGNGQPYSYSVEHSSNETCEEHRKEIIQEIRNKKQFESLMMKDDRVYNPNFYSIECVTK